jgi:lipopolysaccharide transport system ATP-binding protein
VIDGSSADPITVRTAFQIEFEYWNLQPGAYLNLSLHIYNDEGIIVFNAVPVKEATWKGRAFPVGLFRDVCIIPANLLNDGGYRIELLIVQDDSKVIYEHGDILVFDVQDDVVAGQGYWYGRGAGVVRPPVEWQTELIEPHEALNAPVNKTA